MEILNSILKETENDDSSQEGIEQARAFRGDQAKINKPEQVKDVNVKCQFMVLFSEYRSRI